MGAAAGLNEDFNISASREMTVAEIARVIWAACGEDPARFELEHLPTFTVDVRRRWPSVEKARELLGWQSRIDVEEGIADTVRWMRERRAAESVAKPPKKGARRPKTRAAGASANGRAAGTKAAGAGTRVPGDGL